MRESLCEMGLGEAELKRLEQDDQIHEPHTNTWQHLLRYGQQHRRTYIRIAPEKSSIRPASPPGPNSHHRGPVVLFGGSLVIFWYKHHGPFSPVLLRRSLSSVACGQGCSKRKLTFKLGGSKLTFGSSLVQGRKRVCMRLLRAPWGHIPYNVN